MSNILVVNTILFLVAWAVPKAFPKGQRLARGIVFLAAVAMGYGVVGLLGYLPMAPTFI